MKGVIFNEILDFIERHAGSRMLEEVIQQSGLVSGGAYTSVGNYSHEEAVRIVHTAAELLGIEATGIMRQFGFELFPILLARYPDLVTEASDSRNFLRGIQSHIHDEVKKLYPDSSPPEFTVHEEGDELIITYNSHRPMAMIALGLIEGCLAYFNEGFTVRSSPETLTFDVNARFVVSPD